MVIKFANMKEVIVKHFIEYSAFGGLSAEKEAVEVDRRDILPADFPYWAMAFCFYDVAETEAEVNGQKIILRSDPFNKSEKIKLSK